MTVPVSSAIVMIGFSPAPWIQLGPLNRALADIYFPSHSHAGVHTDPLHGPLLLIGAPNRRKS